MKNSLVFTVLVSSLFFTACSQNNTLLYSQTDQSIKGFHTVSVKNIYIRYDAIANEAVESIFKKMDIPKRIIVTDFVDVTSLDNYSRLGYVLSNNIKNSIINNYHTDVVEAEVSKYFKISANGLKILSRDIEKLRATNFQVQYAVVGSYTYTKNEFIVFVKLIDLKTGIIKGSYAKTLPMGEGTKMMLSEK